MRDIGRAQRVKRDAAERLHAYLHLHLVCAMKNAQPVSNSLPITQSHKKYIFQDKGPLIRMDEDSLGDLFLLIRYSIGSNAFKLLSLAS